MPLCLDTSQSSFALGVLSEDPQSIDMGHAKHSTLRSKAALFVQYLPETAICLSPITILRLYAVQSHSIQLVDRQPTLALSGCYEIMHNSDSLNTDEAMEAERV